LLSFPHREGQGQKPSNFLKKFGFLIDFVRGITIIVESIKTTMHKFKFLKVHSSKFRSLLLLFIFVGFTAWTMGCGTQGRRKVPQAGDKIYPVSAIRVSMEEIPDTNEMKGNFIPSDKLEVKSEIDGKVSSVLVNEGQLVEVGQPLATLNPEQLALLLDKQQQELREAEAKAEGSSTIRPTTGFFGGRPLGTATAPSNENAPETPPSEGAEQPAPTPPGQEEQVGEEAEQPSPPSNIPPSVPVVPSKPEGASRAEEATIDRIKAEIVLTQKKIESANITAGIAGVLTKKNVTEGSVVTTGEVLFQIVKIDPIVLSVFLPKEMVGGVKNQDKVDVSAEDLPDQNFSGEISSIATEPDPQNKNYEVKISVPNTQLKIKGGMVGKAALSLAKLRKVLMIPEDAIIDKEGKKYVYVVNDQVADRKEIGLGKKVGEKYEITKGLHEEDQVVLKGQVTFDKEEVFVKVESL
jgi:HlyD family secretion protein